MRITIVTPLLAAAVLALAACSQDKAPAAPAADPPVTTTTVLGGVDLSQPVRALGTEPFWSVEITPQTMTYVGLDNQPQRAANPQPVIQGTTAVYTGATEDGSAMVVTLIATECSDGMSDRTYPLTAKVEVGATTLSGCAASKAMLDTSPAGAAQP